MERILDFFLQYLLKKYWKNIQKTWKYFERTFKKYTNICIFCECSFNIFLENIEEKNLVFYKCSFNILNKIWNLVSCVLIYSHSYTLCNTKNLLLHLLLTFVIDCVVPLQCTDSEFLWKVWLDCHTSCCIANITKPPPSTFIYNI